MTQPKPTLLTRKMRRLAPLLHNARDGHNLKVAADRLEKAREAFGDLRPVVSLATFGVAKDMYNRFAKADKQATDADAAVE